MKARRPLPYESHLYRANRHEAYVVDTWTKGARQPRGTLRALLRRPSTRCLVASVPGFPDDLLGWAAVSVGRRRNAIVWAHTRRELQGRGLATNLLLEMGADVSVPTPMLFWSEVAAEVAARGYRIYYVPFGRPVRGERYERA